MSSRGLGAPFWDATRDRRLVFQWCDDCNQPIHRPRRRCPRCFGDNLGWRPSTGSGAVYAITVAHDNAVALIDLDDGVRMLSNVVGVPVDQVRIGQRVELSWEPMPDGRHLPKFQPTT